MTTTFSPGPAPNTVRTADGKVLTVPEGCILVPPGDPALTRRIKAAGNHYAVAEDSGVVPEEQADFGDGEIGELAVQPRHDHTAAGEPFADDPAVFLLARFRIVRTQSRSRYLLLPRGNETTA